MPKVVCDECETKFSIADGATAKCPVCGKKHKAKSSSSTGDGKSKGAKCPMCKQTLPPHVTFCAKCGVEVDESKVVVDVLNIAGQIEKRRFWQRFFPWW